MMAQHLADLGQALLACARKAGAEAADVLVMAGRSVHIDVRAGALEQIERAEATELGLRVLIGGRQACVAVSDSSPRVMQDMAERAVAMAREAPDDPYAGLAAPEQLWQGGDMAALELCDDAPEPLAQELEQEARLAEAGAMAVTGVTQVQASASSSRHQVYMAAGNGFSGEYARSSHSVSAVAYVGDDQGMERDGAGEGRVWRADMPLAAPIGALAAERALARLGARQPKTGVFPVLFDERVAASLIGHVLSAVNGAAIARGSSWLMDAREQQILPDDLSIIEDPHRPRMSASRLFDGEGLPTRRRLIVDKGVLTGWTLDLATARQLGMVSTANGARGTSGPPGPSNSNIDVTMGQASRAQLLADMGRGLWVTSLIGSTINPTTGDYSRGASGFWVENGAIAYPVHECTIAGNLRHMLRHMVAANDARAHLSVRVPSLLIEGMTLAGS